MNTNIRNFALWVIIVLLLLALFTLFQNPSMRTSGTEISFSQFLTEVDAGRLRDVTIAGQEISGTYIDGRRFQSFGPNEQSWISRVQGKGVSVTIRPHGDAVPWFVSLLVSWLPFVLLVGVWVFLSRQMHGKSASSGSDRPQSSTQIDGLKRRLDDMQKQIDELVRKTKG